MLTDMKCRTAKPREAPYKLRDGKGLYLEVKPNGTKAWRYRFKLQIGEDIRESMFAIGDFGPEPAGETPEQEEARKAGGVFTLDEAREERAKARALVKQGINPAHARKSQKFKRSHESATVFEAVAREWLASKSWGEDTKADRLSMLERVVFPKIGILPVRQITSAHILDVLKTAAKDNGPTVAAGAKRSISGVFALAISTLRADADPVWAVRDALPKNKTQHKRPLELSEIGALLRDLDGYERNFQTVSAFRLMWMTLRRPNEVCGARWNEFALDAGTWTIPAGRMKLRREHTVSLPIQAIDLLQKMHGITGHRKHVFPHRDRRDSQMTCATLRQALKNLKWSGKYSPHATRTTGSTQLNELGYDDRWIDFQLAHADKNKVRGTYNHARYLAPRKTMMQAWADLLDSLKVSDKVTPLRHAA